MLLLTRTGDYMEYTPHLLTIKAAAERLGIPYRQLLESANAEDIPYYRIGKSRRLVSIFEILEFMKHKT